MNFDLSDEEKALADKIDGLIKDAGEDALVLPRDPGADVVEKVLRPWLAKLGEAGYLKSAVGAEAASEQLTRLVGQQALATACPWLMVCAEFGARMLAELVAQFGTDAQREALLPGLLAGEQVGVVAFSEPASGAAAETLDTTAQGNGEGLRVSGEKRLVSLAAVADVIGVFAQTDGGQVLCLVDASAEGVTVGDAVPLLGYDALITAPVKLEGVVVAADRVITPPDNALTAIADAFRRAEDRVHVAASLGLMKQSLEAAQTASNAARAHGKPPAGFQLVRFTLSEMLTSLQTAELLAYRAATALGEGARDAETLALCAKVFVTEAACQVTEQALQITAAGGYVGRNPVEEAFRAARLGPIVGHSTGAARMAIADDALAEFVD